MYQKISIPSEAKKITLKNGKISVPDNPVLLFIEGDGIGPDIWRATKSVLDAAVAKAYEGKKQIEWVEIYAGEKANTLYGPNTWLPDETIAAIREFGVAIKGPLTTPVGEGIRSINVAMRQELDLYACIRPVRWFPGVPAPVKEPQKLNVVVFRENVEDIYIGIEWAAGSPEANRMIEAIHKELGQERIAPLSAIGIKPMSEKNSKRLIRRAIQYALDHNLPNLTLVHKGNIMKFTEGYFRKWGYELANQEFTDQIVTEADVQSKHGGKAPRGKLIVKDRIADNMFQQILKRPDEFSVIATTNLNGDYLSDAAAAQVGGLGIAPGANIGDEVAVFEATHGTAPAQANLDESNPASLILSGVMMLEFLGWKEAARLIEQGLEQTFLAKKVTKDLYRLIENGTLLKTSEFAQAVIENIY
jgi:isocitrate dehydrogenase